MDSSHEAHKKSDFSIYDPVTKILIPVNNYVDSRIGQFAFSHSLSATSFDQLLGLLNDRDIRTSELTFNSGADFESLTAKYRGKPPNPSMGFPLVVLEGVMDAMRTEMGSFVGAVANIISVRTKPKLRG